MDTTHCISNTIWEGYAQKTLSRADMLTLQKHAEGCELCADIKEGIDSLAKAETLSQTVAQINADVDEYLKPKRKRLSVFWFSSAAAVVLVTLGIVWYSMPVLPSQQVAQNSTKPQQESTIIDTSSQKTTTENIDVLGSTPTQEKTETTPAPNATNNKNFNAANSGANNNQSDDALRIDNGVQQAITEPVQVDTAIYFGDGAETPQVVDLLKKSTDVNPTKKGAKRDIYPSNMSTNNNFNNFNNLNTNTWVFSPQQDSINYANALAFFDVQQYDSCIITLQNIVYSPIPYNELAALLKAKTLLKQNKPIQAKEVLNATVFTDKKRKNEAKTLLMSIK